jgi:hypothetical protein
VSSAVLRQRLAAPRPIIVSVGWADKYSIGHPNPVTRTKLSVAQAGDVKALIVALFKDVDAKKGIIPFSSKTASFLGQVGFQTNWIC